MANPTTAVSFDDLRKTTDNASFVRKWSKTILFLAPEDAPEIDDLIDPTDSTLVGPIPAAYWPVGIVAKDAGVTVTTDVTMDGTEGLGYSDPIRKDVESTDRKLNFSPFEVMKRHLFAITHGIAVEDMPAMSPTGSVIIDSPSIPQSEFFRGIRVSVDGAGNRLWIYGTFFPRLQNETIPEETFQTSAQVAPLELTISTDPTLGYPRRDFLGGPAMLANRELLGYALADEGTVPVP